VVPPGGAKLGGASLCSSMEEQFRPKEQVGGSSPSRGTTSSRCAIHFPCDPSSLAVTFVASRSDAFYGLNEPTRAISPRMAADAIVQSQTSECGMVAH
jgi:hypothetical protein